MSKEYSLPINTSEDVFRDNVSINDVATYSFDCSAWAEDNNETITSATWASEYGSHTLSNQSVSNNIVQGRVAFTQSGRGLISILINTATVKKQIWLEVYAKDMPPYTDDYGMNG